MTNTVVTLLIKIVGRQVGKHLLECYLLLYWMYFDDRNDALLDWFRPIFFQLIKCSLPGSNYTRFKKNDQVA